MGASGGTSNNTHVGGYGGYSTGKIKLNKGDKLYINVGELVADSMVEELLMDRQEAALDI